MKNLVLKYEGNTLEVKKIDKDGELGIFLTDDRDEMQCIYIASEQAEILRDYLTKVLDNR